MARDPVALHASTVVAARTEFVAGQPHGELILEAGRQGLLLGEGIEALDRLRRTLSTFRLQTIVSPSLVNQVAPAAETRQALTNANNWGRRAIVLDDMLAVPGAWIAMSVAVASALQEGERLRLALTLAPKIRLAIGKRRRPEVVAMAAFARAASKSIHGSPLFEDDFIRLEVALEVLPPVDELNRESKAVEVRRDRWRKRNALIDEVADLLLEPIPRK